MHASSCSRVHAVWSSVQGVCRAIVVFDDYGLFYLLSFAQLIARTAGPWNPPLRTALIFTKPGHRMKASLPSFARYYRPLGSHARVRLRVPWHTCRLQRIQSRG